MEKRDKTKIHLRDDMQHPGVGLFVDDRAKKSAEEAYSCVIRFLQNENLTVKDDSELRRNMLDTARRYWANNDFDKRISSVELRAEIVALQKALDKVEKVIQGDGKKVDGLSADARAALRAEMHRATLGAGGDPIDDLMARIAAVQAACKPIAAACGEKGPRTKGRVERCCARLWDVRERLTGRAFAKSLDPKLDGLGNATTRFARPDAQFVLAVIQSIDKGVTYSQVHKALRGHERSASRGK